MKRALLCYLFLMIVFSVCVYAQSFDGSYYGVFDDGHNGGDSILTLKNGVMHISIENDVYSGLKFEMNKEAELINVGPFYILNTNEKKWLFLLWEKGFFISDDNGYYSFFSRKSQTRTMPIDNTWIISSKSFLREGKTEYNAGNLMSSVGLPWASGNGFGIGDRLVIDINGVDLPMLILNGYIALNKPNLYFENSRLKTFRLTSKKNGRSKTVNIADNAIFQKIEIGDILQKNCSDEQIFLDVIAVYPGNKYKDLCIKTIIPDFSSN